MTLGMNIGMDNPARALMLAAHRFSRLHLPRPELLAAFDLRPSEVFLLIHLRKADGESGLKPSDLAARLEVTPGNITQMISSLEARGMVMREQDPDDRRIVRARLTEKGRSALEKARETMIKAFTGLRAHLGAEDCDRLTALLSRASDYLAKLYGTDRGCHSAFEEPPRTAREEKRR
jgi:DNA-binding MarR family transcriptional regulator